MPNANFTTAPVAASWGVDPEFVDFRGLEAGWSIKRSNAYHLIAEGLIHSVVIRRKGQIKGRRLIAVQSVRDFLAKQSGDIDPRMSAIGHKANAASLASKNEKRKANGK